MNNNMPRRKGFSFLSFFLGFLIGIIFLVGAVAGVVIYALNANIDNVLGMVGVDNGKDENGNNRVINTDTENGGVETFMQLIGKVSQLAGDTQNLSVGEVEGLIPAVGGMVDGFHGMLSNYIEIDRAELVSVKFSQFGEYVSNKLLDIQPAALMANLGMSGMLENNVVMSLLLEGKEASYVEVGSEKYPVYYDVYNLEEGAYKREGDGAILSSDYRDDLCEKDEAFRIYYYVSDGAAYITDENFTAVEPATRSVGAQYLPYTPDYAELSGNYYFKNEEKIIVNPVTLRTLSDGGVSTLDEVSLTEFIAANDELSNKILGDVTLGDVMSGNVDLSKVLDDLTVGDLVDPGENKLLNSLKDKKLSEMSKAIGELTLDKMMDISPDDKILSQIADATIETLPSKINEITVNSMFAEEIYSVKDEDGNIIKPAKCEQATEYHAEYIYYTYNAETDKYTIVNIKGNDLGKLTAEQFADGTTYYTYGEAQGEWKFLICVKDGEKSNEKAYTINNMATMIGNVSNNMEHATLEELDNAKILVFPPNSLNKTIGGKPLGEMTILDVINFVVALPTT